MNNVGGGSFRAAQEYFQQKTCRFCNQHYTADGIRLLREEIDSLVVKIACSICGRSLGVAIIGTTAETKRREATYPVEWTKRDCAKFVQKPAISYDDVLDAHEFFWQLDSSWAKYLPAIAANMLGNQPS